MSRTKGITNLFGLLKPKQAKIHVGGVYAYATRPHEPDSTFTVVHIDTHKGANIVHVCVERLAISNPHEEASPIHTLSHCPLSEEAITASVPRLLRDVAALPDFEEGYESWREGFEQGQAGVFSRPLADCVGFMEDAINAEEESG